MFDLIAGREKHLPSHSTVTAAALHIRAGSGHRLDIRAPSVVHDRATTGGPDDDGVCRRRSGAASASTSTSPGGRKTEAGTAETRGRGTTESVHRATRGASGNRCASPTTKAQTLACREVSRAASRGAS